METGPQEVPAWGQWRGGEVMYFEAGAVGIADGLGVGDKREVRNKRSVPFFLAWTTGRVALVPTLWLGPRLLGSER